MSATVLKHFDLINCIKEYKKLGVSEEIAECHARHFEEIINIAEASAKKELATKKDIADLEIRIDLKLEKFKNQLFIWLGSLIIASGLLNYFHH